MAYVIYILVFTIQTLLGILEFAMLLRAILSLFILSEESPLGNLLYYITEPVILPIRALCDRFGWFQDTPIDMPFLITNLLLSLFFFVLM